MLNLLYPPSNFNDFSGARWPKTMPKSLWKGEKCRRKLSDERGRHPSSHRTRLRRPSEASGGSRTPIWSLSEAPGPHFGHWDMRRCV